MILGPVSLLDCLVFLIFLAPQLILVVGLFRTIIVGLNALPFLILKLPFQLVQERYFTSSASRPRFVGESTLFERLVVRCVRYAFANVPAHVGRVFFSKWVALPFLYWRMLRHGYLKCPVHWREYEERNGSERFQGVWVQHKPEQPPDFVLYYVHGGGFAMGSCYFYLEFLLVWHHLLVEAGYRNPAIFALDYTLVPDNVYPKQVHEALAGYRHVLGTVKDASKVCVAGDSAGGCLILSLLQELGANQLKRLISITEPRLPALALPRMTTLISPWCTLMTALHQPSSVDYLDRQTLWRYAHEYAGASMINKHPASPGSCEDDELWRISSPQRGYYIVYGDEEVLAADVESFLKKQDNIGVEISSVKVAGGIHAWSVASLFLSSTEERRLHGLRSIVKEIRIRFVGSSGMRTEGERDGQIRSSKQS